MGTRLDLTDDETSDRSSLPATINGTPDFVNDYSVDADQRLTDKPRERQRGTFYFCSLVRLAGSKSAGTLNIPQVLLTTG